MTITASAPGRCGIVGNPSDIYGGTVLSCSIPARATCRLTLGEGERLPEDRRLWNAAVARYPVHEAQVEWSTDIPRSSGLSGSTALLAATMACVMKARGEAPDLSSPEGRLSFSELVRDVESVEAGIVCGYQDATMIVHGGLQRMDFAGKHPIHGGPPAKLMSLEAPRLPFLLITTGVERLSGSVHGPMRDRWLSGEPAVVSAMSRVAELGQEGASAFERGDLEGLARAMNENHRLIAELGGSGKPTDQLIEECLSLGALAAKLAGAGLGGTVIALTEAPGELENKLRALGYTRFMRPVAVPGVRYE